MSSLEKCLFRAFATFIAALFTIARERKQPICLSTEEWIKKIWSIYTMEYYSIIKNEILPFATRWMDLDVMVNKSDRERKMLLTLMCRI